MFSKLGLWKKKSGREREKKKGNPLRKMESLKIEENR